MVPMVAVALTFIVAVAAFAVDLGMQRVVRRDMQAVADIVSLDVVRTLQARPAGDVLSDAAFRTAVKSSVDRNAVSSLGEEPTVVVEVGSVQASGAFLSAGSVSYTASSAGVSAATVLQPAAVATAVRVSASGSVAFAFAPGHGAASRSAVAVSDASGCFSVGSYAARVSTGSSAILGPLNQVLGTGAALTALDLQGLADAQVTALDLIGTDLTAGGFSELVTTTVRLTDLYVAMASVLRANDGSAATIAVLDRLGQLSLSSLHLELGQVVDLGTGSASALTAGLNVLDIVTAAALVANGTNPIAIPDATVSVPGVSQLTARAVIGQKPVVVCGRAGQAHGMSTQVTLDVSGTLVGVDLGLARITAPLSVRVALDPATVSLTGLRCATDTRTLDLTGWSGLVDTRVEIGSSSEPDLLEVRAAGIPVANGYVVLTGSRPAGTTESGSIAVTNESYLAAAPFLLGEESIGLPGLSTSSHIVALPGTIVGAIVSATLGGLVNGVVAPLLDVVVDPVLQAVDTALLDPLLRSLGVNLTGADVHARPKADCGFPRLAG